MLSESELEKYTKETIHHGVNEAEILTKFMKYAAACNDPENIFRYMEQKAICTFLSSFWVYKAEYLASIGDFVGCFQCIQMARDRRGIEEEDSVDIAKKEAELVGIFMSEMRSYPLKSKRSVQEYNFTNSPIPKPNPKDGLKKIYEKILPIYQTKYGGLRKQKEKHFKMSRQKMPASWVAEEYEKQEIQEKKIEEKIHENSMKLSKDVKYHSMHTPIKFRDPQRLTKTMDSVEILRKKRSTNEKIRNRKNLQKYDSDEQFQDVFDASNTKMMNSVPVGKSFSNLKRRVTFDIMDLKRANFKLSDVKTTPEVGVKGSNLKNVANQGQQVFSADKIDEDPQIFKSLPHPPTKNL